jgi:anti-sigma-K factor RskA
MMSDIDVHHLAAAYALDALDQHERAAFEAHYESCDVCRSDVLEFRETMASVAESLAAPPPPSLKDRVMADIAVTRQLSPLAPVAPVVPLRSRTGGRNLLLVAAAVVALLAAVAGIVAITGRNDTSFSDELAHVMEQPDARVVDLAGKGDQPGSFKVAWSPSTGQAALIGENLPTAPSDKAYELWLVTPEKTMAMYVLDPASNGQVHRMLRASADPSAWAITIEPASGTPVATGDIIYLGEV